MKNIKVIMCDIDGTLLNSKGIVTSKTIDAIKKVREQGILFGISTGRDVPSVKRLFGKWGIGGLVDMIVGSNGGEIYDYKTDYYEENFAQMQLTMQCSMEEEQENSQQQVQLWEISLMSHVIFSSIAQEESIVHATKTFQSRRSQRLKANIS